MSVTSFYPLPSRLDDPDDIALFAGRIYWLALVLTDREDTAATLTRKGASLLFTPPHNQFFNRWLEKWACRMTIKSCVALKHRELQADQLDSYAWDELTNALQSEPLELASSLSRHSIERAIRTLPVLPRFMFVVHTLNGYSLQEAANLLGISRTTCDAASRHALVALTRILHLSELSSWMATHKFA